MSERIKSLSGYQIEVLREIGNIGSGHAATALAKMLQRRINMDLPKVRIIPLQEASELIGPEDSVVVAVHMELKGDVKGSFIFVLEYEMALKLANLLLRKPINTQNELDDLSISAIRETGNILTSSYISAISALTNLKMSVTIPEIIIDMAGAVISVPAIEYAQYGENMLYIEADFFDGGEKIGGKMLLVPEMNSYAKLLTSLGVMD